MIMRIELFIIPIVLCYKSFTYELIIVDDGSPDKTSEV